MYALYCRTIARSPVRPDASTGSGQGVHGVSKDWVEVLKPSLDAVRLTVRAKPVEALPGHPPVRAESVEAFGLNQAPGSLVRSGAAPSPRRATYFTFASPKESRQRKGDPTVCVPPLCCGQPAVPGPAGGLASTLPAQTIARPDPSGPALLGAYRRGWGPNSGRIKPVARSQ